MWIGFELFFMGNIAFVEGGLNRAKDYFLESNAVLTQLKHVYRVNPRANLCHVARAQGDSDLARDYLLDALRSGIEHRSISPIMYCLPPAALLTADDGNHTRAVELYSLAQQFGHIRNSRWFADVACRELDEIRASLVPEVAAAAEARGHELDVWETTEALLLDLSNR